MTPLETLGFALGASFASGLNLYASVAVLGVFHRYGLLHLPPTLEVLAHPVVVGVAVALYLLEFAADKIPYVDNVWDVIHTFIRPPAAALLAYTAFGPVAEPWRLAAALLAGSVALTSHGTKASARAAANTSPEPFSNWLLSLGGDGVAILVTWLAATHPLLTLVLVAVLVGLSIFVLVKLFGFLRRVFAQVFRPRPATALPPGDSSARS